VAVGPARPQRAAATLGQAAASAATGRPLGGRLAGGNGIRLRATAVGPLEGGTGPVAGQRPRRGGQGGGGRSGGLPQAVHAGDVGGVPDGRADRGAVLRALPGGGRVPGPQAASGLGGVPSVDAAAHRADDAGIVRDHGHAAAVGVVAGGVGGGGLVAATAVESAEGEAGRAGRTATAARGAGGVAAASGGVAGK